MFFLCRICNSHIFWEKSLLNDDIRIPWSHHTRSRHVQAYPGTNILVHPCPLFDIHFVIRHSFCYSSLWYILYTAVFGFQILFDWLAINKFLTIVPLKINQIKFGCKQINLSLVDKCLRLNCLQPKLIQFIFNGTIVKNFVIANQSNTI